MKIFIFSRNKIVTVFILLVLLGILFLVVFKTPLTITVSANESETFSEETANKITNLINCKERVAYLTFDDGPSLNVTPKILDILKEENVKASFFVIGKYVDTYPEITKRAYDEGHFIANHGYNHNNSILYKNNNSFINEIKKTDLAISNAIGINGYCSHVFRFPNGYMSPNFKGKKNNAVKLLSQMGYTYIDWNCLNNDSIKKYSKEQLLDNLKKTTKGKDTLVVLMHDTKFVSDSSIVLRESIKYLKSLGYTFKNFYSMFP